MRGQKGNILLPVAERLAGDGKDIEKQIQVLADAMRAARLLVRQGGRGDHTDIERLFSGIAQAGHSTVLQRGQEFALYLEGQFFDIIEEQRATMREFQLAGLVARGAVGGTAHLPP